MAKKAKKSRRKAALEKMNYEVSSGDVFVDFGYAHPEEAKAKWDLAFLIRSIIKQRNITQARAASLMHIDQPKVSKIMRGLLSEFTIERLMNYLVALGFDIEIKPVLSKETIPSIHVVRSNGLKGSRARL